MYETIISVILLTGHPIRHHKHKGHSHHQDTDSDGDGNKVSLNQQPSRDMGKVYNPNR